MVNSESQRQRLLVMARVPSPYCLGDERWIVTHRKMIAARQDELFGMAKASLPLSLKMKWIIVLTENREGREVAIIAAEGASRFPIQRFTMERVREIPVKRASLCGLQTAQECRAALPVEMATDTEACRGDSRNQSCPGIELAEWRAPEEV